MTLAAWDFHGGTLLAALAAFALGFLVNWWFGKRGKSHEEVLRRVVETSTDESTRLKTLSDEHSHALKLKDDSIVSLKGDYDGQLGSLRADLDKSAALVRTHEADLSTHKAEATRLQGLVATVDTSKAEIDGLKAELAKQKNDYELTLGDWRKRAETGEAAKAAAEKRIADADAEHARVVGEWSSKVSAAESAAAAKVSAAEAKAVEVQGLLGSTKADNDKADKALAEWRLRAEKAEGDLGNWSRRYAELETSQKNADAEHQRVAADWRKRAETAEASVADSAKRGADWEAKFNAAEAERAKVAAEWQAKYSALEGDRAKVAADWESRYKALEGQHASLQGQHTELTGFVSTRDTEIQGLRGQLAEATAGPDDLKVIEGIGPKIDQALRADGLTRWVHIRDASQDRLKSAIEKGGITFAPSMVTWPKQAAYLVAGDQAGFKQYTEYLISGQDPSSYGGEVVTGTERVEALASGAVYGSGNVEVAEEAKNKDGSDNLLIVEGIGPKFNEALLKAGINTFAKLAASSEDQLKGAIQAAGLSFAPSLSTWAEQSGLLARGDMAAFKVLTDRLVAGRNDG